MAKRVINLPINLGGQASPTDRKIIQMNRMNQKIVSTVDG